MFPGQAELGESVPQAQCSSGTVFPGHSVPGAQCSGASLFCDTGGRGGVKSWRRQALFQGRHCFCPTPTLGEGVPVKEAGTHSPPCPQYLLRIYSLKESQPGAGADTGALITLGPRFEPTTCRTQVQCSTAGVLTRSGYLLQNENYAYKYCPPKRPTHSWPTPTQGGGRVFPLRAPRISKKAGRHPPPGGGCARH